MLDHQAGRHMLVDRRYVAERGVTLVEALITISILGILLAMSLPGLQNWLLNARIRTASEETLAGLQLARGEAVRRNCSTEFVLNTVAPVTGAGWTVQTTAGCPGGVSVIQTRQPNEGTAGVTVTPFPAGASQLTFDGLGRLMQTTSPPLKAVNINGSDAVTRVDIDLESTILAPGDTRDLRINIQVNGQMRLCDPNVSVATDSRYCS